MAVSLVRVPITPTLNVMSLHREHSREPLFVLREFDVKVLRQVVHNRNKKKGSDDEDDEDVKTSPQQKNKRMDGEMQFMVTGSSEQALRVSIRAAVLRLGLAMEAATAHEIKLLKDADVLGKRAPSASLLTGTDMCRLLRAFGANSVATKLSKQLDTLEPGVLIPSSGDADMDAPRRKPSTTRVKHETDENSILLKKRKSRERMKRESPSSSPAYSRPRSLSHGHRPLEGDSYVSDDDASSLSSDEHAAAGGYVPSRSYQRGSGSGSEPLPIYESQSLSSSFHSQPQHFHANPAYQPPTFPQFESAQHRNSTYSTTHPQTHSLSASTQSHSHSMESGNQTLSNSTNSSHAHEHAGLIHSHVHATPSTGSSDPHSHSYSHVDHHYHHHSQQSTTHHTIHHTNGTYHGTHHTTTGTIIQPSSSQSSQQQQLHIQQQQQQQQSFHSHSSSRGQTTYESTGLNQHSGSIINDTSDPHHQFIAPHQRHIRPPLILAPSACPPTQYTSSQPPRSNKRGAAAISPQVQTSSKQVILGFPNPPKQRITPITIPTQPINNQYIAHNLNAFVSVVSPAVSGNNTPTATVSLPVSSPTAAASAPNSQPSTPIQHSIVRPSVSTQHLSSLRAFSAHPFNKRRSTNSGLAIDEHIIDTDMSDFVFPPLSERVETLRVDTSSLLPKALIIDDPQTTSSTIDSSDSSTPDDIMESMDALEDVDLDNAFEITTQSNEWLENGKSSSTTAFDSAYQTATTIKHETSQNSVFDSAFQAAKLLHQKNRSLHTHHDHHTHLSHPVPAMAS